MAKKEVYQYGKKNFVQRIQELVELWKEIAKPSLRRRKKLLELRASGYYDETDGRQHVLNLTDRGVSTIVPFLVEGNPRVLVETQVFEYRPWAYTTTLALNYLIQKMELAKNVLIPAAVNSMFGAAITRTDFYYERLISLENESIKIGIPRVELIDDTNYIGDPSAKRRSDFAFEGDIYTLPTDYARDFFSGKDKFGKQIADYISSDNKILQEFSPRDITNPNIDKKMFSLREYTTFVDLYLRDEGTIITIMPKGKVSKILREREWEGPGDGPYDYLGYNFMPESPIPIPPTWFWHDMDVSANIVIDKLRELVENQKDIIGYSAENEEDVKRAIAAPNIGVVRQDNPQAMTKISLGGITNNSNWDYLQFIMSEQTKQGANPDVLGGRGAQAPTLGQEQMVYQNATRVVGNMYSRYQDFETSIIRKLAWAYWTDPTMEVPVVKDIPGVGPIPTVFSSSDKVGDFYDFVFEIVPYSTQRTSPEMQYQKIMQLMTQWVLPTLQLGQAQGAELSVPDATQMLADYLGVKSFRTFYKTVVPRPGESVPYQMQPTTNRKEKGASDAFGSLLGNLQQNSERQAGVEQNKAMNVLGANNEGLAI
jgi:hypothetical protein